uniref:Uncharacterized protein n=1 Tax=Acrobeloides nanus TaxID=290746 RepID=A0A914EMS5_9BILA
MDLAIPTIDCSQIDSFIQPASSWNTTKLIQSLYYTDVNWNKTYYFHNYVWGTTQWVLFRTAYLNNNISLIINSTTLTNSQKHLRIFDVFNIFLNGYVNKQFFYCVPLSNWGYLSDYKKCAGSTLANWTCEVPLACIYPRNNLIKIQCSNTTTFTNAWNNFTSSLNASYQAQVQPYTNNITSIIYGTIPSGGVDQQVAQVVAVIISLKTAIPTLAASVDGVVVGNWGNLKKFQDCQSTANITQYPN